MPTYLTAVLIVLGSLALIALLNWIQSRNRRKEIARAWGRTGETFYRRDNVEDLEEALDFERAHLAHEGEVDAQTWSDLSLQHLFERMDISYSSLGQEYLYTRLHLLKGKEAGDLEEWQSFLAEHPDVRLTLQHYFSGLGKLSDNRARQMIASPPSHKINLWLTLLLASLPLGVIVAIIIDPKVGFILLSLVALVNGTYYMTNYVKLEQSFHQMGFLIRMMRLAQKVSRLETPLSSLLADHVKPFKSAIPFRGFFVKKYASSDADFSLSMLNMIFLFPILGYVIMTDKLGRHKDQAREVHEQLSRLELAISLLNFKANLPFTCQPTFQDEAGMTATDLYHPLLNNPVANPLDFTGNLMLSGDNASGKSTYLKAVALSAITAQTLGFAMASHFSLAPGEVLTTINVEDDILRGESYFMAESNLIKRMLNRIEKPGLRYLFFDEIFRGTNSTERISAALSIIDWLSKQTCLFMMSSHDMKLVDGAASYMRQYHFETRYADGQIHFDYLLKEGKAETSNAIKVLSYLDYPAEIVEQAQAHVAKLASATH